MNNTYWGYHLMLDCAGCNDNIKDKQAIYNFVKDLINQIDMVAHGEPVIEFLLPGEPNEGYSLMQLITTSNICGHFIDRDHTAYFDIFSCKPFDLEIAKQVVDTHFTPSKVKEYFITRQAG